LAQWTPVVFVLSVGALAELDKIYKKYPTLPYFLPNLDPNFDTTPVVRHSNSGANALRLVAKIIVVRHI